MPMVLSRKRFKHAWESLSWMSLKPTRGTNFYPDGLEKGIRSERALRLALAEMYVQGVSTRKVAAITEELIGGPG